MKLRLVLALSTISFFTSCSPFGDQSLISEVVNTVSDALTGKPSYNINSGGNQQLVSTPASGLASDVHQVSIMVGSPYAQAVYQTDKGHTVDVVITSE